MEYLIGHFYYKKTHNGNLIGEFSNNNLTVVTPELAEVEESSESFIGTFNICWIEFGEATMLKLKIDYKPNTNKRVFNITWSDEKEIWFYGEGFIVDNMLIGSYRDFE